jgi:hypothetical protein
MGAPELPRIAALVKFRRDHAAELTTNPALAAYVTSEIAAIEELRRAVGARMSFSVFESPAVAAHPFTAAFQRFRISVFQRSPK